MLFFKSLKESLHLLDSLPYLMSNVGISGGESLFLFDVLILLHKMPLRKKLLLKKIKLGISKRSFLIYYILLACDPPSC